MTYVLEGNNVKKLATQYWTRPLSQSTHVQYTKQDNHHGNTDESLLYTLFNLTQSKCIWEHPLSAVVITQPSSPCRVLNITCKSSSLTFALPAMYILLNHCYDEYNHSTH